MGKKFFELHSVMDMLREVCKLPCKNKKIYFFIFLSTLIPYFPQFLFIIYPPKSVSFRFSTRSVNSTSLDDPKQRLIFEEGTIPIILREVVLFFLMSMISFFSMVTTIYVSAMTYLQRQRDLKVKDLFKKIKNIWFRPMLTEFYSIVMGIGLLVLAIPLTVILVILKQVSLVIVIPLGIVLVILAIYLFMYFTLVWQLSIVTSVLEDCYGLQAIGKGAELLKGRKMVGFVLNFVLIMIPVGVTFILESMMNKNIYIQQPVILKLLISFCGMNFDILVTTLSLMMYTVFYLDCKHSRGEDVADEENMGFYTKVSTFPLVDSAALP
ncbi:hypothetical protein FRX31_012467 [Thalictrum thalictroides]|uniref:Transmembrane protein n=1 Tax=Thalictrum thalictroides TaxID=46969 RepID=A0A7J6WLY4_THATH|nr:hypothetical protein FRX31_012467 [Thalictrum thalictroides]